MRTALIDVVRLEDVLFGQVASLVPDSELHSFDDTVCDAAIDTKRFDGVLDPCDFRCLVSPLMSRVHVATDTCQVAFDDVRSLEAEKDCADVCQRLLQLR